MEYLEEVGRELIELHKQYKDIEKRYKEKKEQIKNMFLSEDISEKIIDGIKITKIPEDEQMRVVGKENLLNIISDKIEDDNLAGDLIAELLKNSSIKSYIKISHIK